MLLGRILGEDFLTAVTAHTPCFTGIGEQPEDAAPQVIGVAVGEATAGLAVVHHRGERPDIGRYDALAVGIALEDSVREVVVPLRGDHRAQTAAQVRLHLFEGHPAEKLDMVPAAVEVSLELFIVALSGEADYLEV